MNPICITTEDLIEMVREFGEKGMDFVALYWETAENGKQKVTFSASSDDIDYSIDYEFQEK